MLCEAASHSIAIFASAAGPGPPNKSHPRFVYTEQHPSQTSQLAGGRLKWILNGTKQTAQVHDAMYLIYDVRVEHGSAFEV